LCGRGGVVHSRSIESGKIRDCMWLGSSNSRGRRVRVGGHGRGREETSDSDYETCLSWFNWNQGLVTGIFENTVETVGARLSDARRPIFVSLDEVVIFVPNSFVSMSGV
jgi:hypothetical protein